MTATRIALAAAVLVLPLQAWGQQGKTPREIIQGTHDAMVVVITDRREELRADTEELIKVVDEILLPHFDRRGAGQFVMGKYWRQASDEQKERFINALYRSLIRTYASGILDYNGEGFMIDSEDINLEKRRAKVFTTVTLDNGTEVPLEYQLRLKNDEWVVWNVVIEGINYALNLRSQYASEFRSKGIEAVVADLEAKDAAGEKIEVETS